MKTNPVLWLELRIRSSEKRLWLLALFGMLVMAVVSGLVFVLFYSRSHFLNSCTAQTGSQLAWSCLGCHAAIMILLAPLAGAGRISSEREQRTLPALLNTPLSRWSILWGKLVASWFFVLWLGLTALPFLAVATIWGGPSPLVVLAGFSFNILAGLTLATLSMGLSGWFGKSLTSYLSVGAVLIGWLVVTPLLGVLFLMLDKAHKGNWGEAIGYLSFHHVPCAPLIQLCIADSDGKWDIVFPRLASALAVWFAVALVAAWMALRGIKREV